MNKTSLLAAAALTLIVLFATSCRQKVAVPYRDVRLSIDKRVDDLVGRMTLEQKVAQMTYDAPGIDSLGIAPYNWWNECLHGVARAGRATVFPQAIGMAAMWDRGQMERIAMAISDEARAKHHDFIRRGKHGIYQGLTYWTPNINIFRDPRWGRGMETYGEDPYLTGELAVPFVRGLQGDDPHYLKLVATAKHFSVHSGPESTRHTFDVRPSDYDFFDTYTPHFRKVVQQAGVYSVMCAYQRFRGMPCCGSAFLEDLLRNQWGFQGYIVSDCGAIADFYKKDCHEVTATREEAAAMAVAAGTDLNCGGTYTALVEAVHQGLISETEIDVAVKRLMKARMRLGMFDPEEKVSYSKIPMSVVESDAHRQLACETAEKSMVLLKNDGQTLPLSRDLKRVAVIGPNADDMEVLLANYNGYPTQPVTPLEGIRRKLPSAQVTYAVGCPVAEGLPIFEAVPTNVLFTDTTLTTPGLHASYYDNSELEGEPRHVRTDASVDFTWGAASPFDDIGYEQFSVRWEGVLVPPVSGNYAIGGEAFSGCDIYIGDSLLVSRYDTHNPRKEYEYVQFEAGRPVSLRMEFRQRNTEWAMARLLWQQPGRDLRQEALDAAREADAVVFCMGLSPLLEGEEMKVKVDGFSGGDRLDICLPEVQTRLMQDVMALGKPAVLVLFNGSALAVNWEQEHIPAILEAWYPGQEGGMALANVLFGDVNPAGRLPLTFYKSIDQIPAFDNYDMTGKTYRYFRGAPLYEFGYGLSYTSFQYRLVDAPTTFVPDADVTLRVEVTNAGACDGDEVVQLYVSHPEATGKHPVRALSGFERIHLKAGERRTLDFTLTPAQLQLLDDRGRQQQPVRPVTVSIGSSQPSPQALANKTVVEHRLTVL